MRVCAEELFRVLVDEIGFHEELRGDSDGPRRFVWPGDVLRTVPVAVDPYGMVGLTFVMKALRRIDPDLGGKLEEHFY